MHMPYLRFALVLSMVVAAHSAGAQPQKASTITIYAGSSVGGLYDLTARLWSRHLGRFLPGEPTVIVQNMPGAGGLTATNHLANLAPRDGTALGVVNASAVLLSLFGDPSARFDPRHFAWIGGRSMETAVCAFWHESHPQSFEDLRRTETVIGSSGPGARSYTHAIMFNALLGTKFRNVSGYPGGSEMSIAMERREIDGECGWSWGSLKSRTAQWLRDGKLRILAQSAMKKNPELPDVPMALDLAPTPEARAVMEALLTDTLLAWPLIGPPGMPEQAITRLRLAFNSMMSDPALLKDAERSQLEVDIVRGEEMHAIVNKLFALPPPIIDRAKTLFK